MTAPLAINFILPGYATIPIGGYRVVFEYSDFLAARGHTVRINFPMCMSMAPNEKSFLKQVRRLAWRLKTRARNRPLVAWHKFHPNVRLCLVSEVRDSSISDADVCVATGWNTAQPVLELSRSKGAKFYLIQHHETMFGPPEDVNATWLLPLKKIVISKWLEELGDQLGATNMRHIPNGINFELFNVQNPPACRPMHIVTLFHSEGFKGVADALAVLENYHSRFPDVPVTMFGVPERPPAIPGWINYIRNPSQHVLVKEIYNRATIYLSASLVEGWALPPAEAMACGCAFVGTDIGGFREYSVHDDTALLSPVGDRQSMLHNLERISSDRTLLRRIQERGTEKIRGFTWEKAGGLMEEYFFEQVALERS